MPELIELNSSGMGDESWSYLGSESNPYVNDGVVWAAFLDVCALISEDLYEAADMTPDKVFECDEVVRRLELDTYRARYFYRSRLNDQTNFHQQITVKTLLNFTSPQQSIQNGQSGTHQNTLSAGSIEGIDSHLVLEYEIPRGVEAVAEMVVSFEHSRSTAIRMNHQSIINPEHYPFDKIKPRFYESFTWISSNKNNDDWIEETYRE